MNSPEIIHVDDEQLRRDELSSQAEQKMITYLGMESYYELREHLRQGARAKIHVLDGLFFIRPGTDLDFLADAATQTIREVDPHANILWWTSSVKDAPRAKECNVEYHYKQYVPAKKLMHLIQQRIET